MPDITDAVAGPVPQNFDPENADNLEDVSPLPPFRVNDCSGSSQYAFWHL